MNLAELKNTLKQHPEKLVGFVLPDGETIPIHSHVTEVGHVRKDFVDCGGKVRHTASAVLQIWEGNDTAHRLSAGKLASILDLTKSIVPHDDLEVEVEYEACSISQYPLETAEVSDGQLSFRLGSKHTDCLAKEACGVESASSCCGGGCG